MGKITKSRYEVLDIFLFRGRGFNKGNVLKYNTFDEDTWKKLVDRGLVRKIEKGKKE